MKKLAASLVNDQPITIDVPLYWMYKKNKYGVEKIVILDDDKAKKLLEDPEKRDSIEYINTVWRVAGWEEQNEIVADSQEQNEFSGVKEPNWQKYRNERVHKLLLSWDLEHEGKNLPVTAEYIRKIPAEIMLALFDKYEKAAEMDPDKKGK